jgi:uncharacterized membrane protein
MKTFWKWIIGIVLALVVLAVLVGVGFAFRTGYMGCGVRAFDSFDRTTVREYGMMSYDGTARSYGMMPYGGMTHSVGMMPFGGFFGGLVQLGVLTLIVLGIVWLVRSLRKPAAVPAALAACGKCGKVVQPDWNHCPSCGKKL